MPGTKHILNISPVENLRRTRELMLEEAGFVVTSIGSLRETQHVCRRASFDLVMIEQSLEADEKRMIAASVREHCKDTPIMEICRVSPEVPNAEYVLRDPSPE